jgi:thioredoxin 1
MKYALIILIIAAGMLFANCNPDPFAFQLDQALINGKPTLAEFGGQNCAPCKAMWPVLTELAKDYHDTYNIIIIDVSKNQELANRYNIRMIPIQVYFDKYGQPKKNHLGGVTREEILQELQNIDNNE